jgi:hypothetical protein
MKTFKVSCLVDICTKDSKDELKTLYVKAENSDDAESAVKYDIIEKGWCVSDIKVIGTI